MFVDPRGQRFGAALTSIILTAVVFTGSGWLLAAQALVFATAVIAGAQRSPYAVAFRWLAAPRLGPPVALEPAGPPRFAQGVGLTFALIGIIGYAAGTPAIGALAAGIALFAAFLNAAFGVCLGCEMYLAIRRIHARLSDSSHQEGASA